MGYSMTNILGLKKEKSTVVTELKSFGKYKLILPYLCFLYLR